MTGGWSPYGKETNRSLGLSLLCMSHHMLDSEVAAVIRDSATFEACNSADRLEDSLPKKKNRDASARPQGFLASLARSSKEPELSSTRSSAGGATCGEGKRRRGGDEGRGQERSERKGNYENGALLIRPRFDSYDLNYLPVYHTV